MGRMRAARAMNMVLSRMVSSGQKQRGLEGERVACQSTCWQNMRWRMEESIWRPWAEIAAIDKIDSSHGQVSNFDSTSSVPVRRRVIGIAGGRTIARSR